MTEDKKNKIKVDILKEAMVEMKSEYDILSELVDHMKLAADIVSNGIVHPSAFMKVVADMNNPEKRISYERDLSKVAYDGFDVVDFMVSNKYIDDNGKFDLNGFLVDKL